MTMLAGTCLVTFMASTYARLPDGNDFVENNVDTGMIATLMIASLTEPDNIRIFKCWSSGLKSTLVHGRLQNTKERLFLRKNICGSLESTHHVSGLLLLFKSEKFNHCEAI